MKSKMNLSKAGLFGIYAIAAAIVVFGLLALSLTSCSTGGSGKDDFTTLEMIRVTGGTFTMGSPSSEPGRDNDETQHKVTLSGFYMGKFPVTQAQYEAVMGSNPSGFTEAVEGEKKAHLPVENVTWFDAIRFCNKLSEQSKLEPVYTISGQTVTADLGKNGYRLPTEAQWEYACRAGTSTAYSTGSISEATGWYWETSDNRTHEVGKKPANAFGLYDMAGNVYEWCWDRYGAYATGAQTDPEGTATGDRRVLRGGAWPLSGENLRSAYRGVGDPSYKDSFIGFRVVRP